MVPNTVAHDPNGGSGHDPKEPVPTTESAPRRCPEWEGRNPSHTESTRRRCPDVELPQLEAAEGAATVQRGHGEDTDEGVGLRPPAGGDSTTQCKGGCPRILPEPFRQEVAGDRDVDQLGDHHWRQHLRELSVEVAERKRWKSGYW